MSNGARLAAAGLALFVLGTARTAFGEYRPPEYGYAYGEIEGPRTLAMGGAARAWGWSTSAIPLNPANLPSQQIYHFEALGGLDTRAHRLQFGGAIVDSVTSRLALGVLATKTDLGDSDPYKRGTLDVRVGAGFPVSDRVSFGVTGHFLRATQTGNGPLGASPVSRSDADDPNYRQITFDAGLALALSDAFRLALVGYNLTNTNNQLLPLMVGGGLGFHVGDATVEADVLGVDRITWGAWKARLQVGGEILVGDHFPLRLGYTYDQGAGRHSISAGTGYVDKQFAFDAAVRHEVATPGDPYGRALVFAVGLRYFYESAAPPESSATSGY